MTNTMKPTFSFHVIFLSLVLAAVSAPGVVCGQRVLDTTSNPVEPGVPYYIIPAKAGTGGGLVPSSRTFDIKKLCPLDVVQSPFPFIPGVPVTFTLQNTTDGFVQLDTIFNIEFNSSVWLCPQSKVWRGDGSLQNEYTYISTGGAIGGADSWFTLRQDGDAYKLLYCRNDSIFYNIGTYGDKFGVQRLILSDGFLPVKFQKAYEANGPVENTMLRMFPVTK